jgi:Homeodomain-like domain
VQIEREGLEVLRPRERRRPKRPNQLPVLVEERIVAFALGHPGLGPRRIASELARPKWGGIVVSANGVWRCLRRHGLNTRGKRLSLIAGYRAPYEPPREPAPEPHIEVERPGQLVGVDCFYLGRLRGTAGAIWQLTAIDVYSSFAWAELVICKQGNPTAAQASTLARRVARELQAAGWRLERVLADNGNEFRGERPTPRSNGSAQRSRTSTPAGRRRTGTSKRSTRRSSTSAGDRPSPAISTPATRA